MGSEGTNTAQKVDIAVISSGRGENLRYILQAERRGDLPGRVVLVLANEPDAGALRIGREFGVTSKFVDPMGMKRDEYDQELLKNIDSFGASLVVLTGYNRILSSAFVSHFRDRILNVHPALLPAFRGANAFQQALDHGVRWTGTTIHVVDEEVDHGPIIYQVPVRVLPGDTYDTLKARIQKAEYIAYPKAIKIFIEGQFEIEGRKIVFYEDRADQEGS